MNQPTVSVIVPNYNHEAFLPLRLKSILDQTYQDFELILLDDCSPDNSRKILTAFAEKDPRARTVFNDKNSGSTFAQWNKGVRLAKGKYVWIAESDDYCEPTLLETLVQMMEQNQKVGIAFAQSFMVDEQNKIINSFNENYKFIYKSDRWKSDFVMDGKKECAEYLIYSNSIPNASGALFKRETYLACGGAETNWKLNGDWFFYVKMLLISDLAFSAQHLNYFRFHTNTQRHKANANHVVYDEIIYTIKYIENHVNVDPEKLKVAWRNVANWWGGSLFRQDISTTFFKENFRLLKFFRKKRPRILLNIISNSIFVAIGNFLDFIRIKPVIKKWRAKLFPGKYFEY